MFRLSKDMNCTQMLKKDLWLNKRRKCSQKVPHILITLVTFGFIIGCENQNDSSTTMMSDLSLDQKVETEEGIDHSVDMMITDQNLTGMNLGDMADRTDLELIPDMEIFLDMEVGPPACLNGLDDDEDGQIDYPRDPGCESLDDEDEVDPSQFACEDEIDNDGDGVIDADDPGCSGPSDSSEESACGPHQAIDISNRSYIVVDSEGEPSYFEACRSNNAPEQTFLFTLRRPVEYLYFSTEGSAFDTLLSVRRNCDDPSSEVACNDDGGAMGMTHSTVQLDQPALGDYYIIVDGYGESAGRVVLTVEAGVAEGEVCPEEGGPLLCPRGQACSLEGVCAPAECADLEDNDQDDRTDYPSDPGCERPEDQDESDPDPLPECGDTLDNDGDGGIDFPNDLQCDSAADPREGRDPACDDREDNDRDGLFDFPNDPGCESADDTNEYNAPACDDGRDNDEDGRIDFPNDPGCTSEEDGSERTPRDLPQCADGIDNDEDGLIDYPEDQLSCQFAADRTEDDPCARRSFRDITGLTSTRGTHEGEPNDFGGSCGGEDMSESLLVWRVAQDRPLDRLKITTRNSEALAVVYAKDQCEADNELFCSFNSSLQAIEVGPRAGGEDLYLFVDARFFSGIWRLQFEAYLAEGARCDREGIPGERWQCAEGLFCVEEISGLSKCIRPQCDDQQDNDGDGRIDYPNDPGCNAPSTDSELDPDPLPACSNDIDEDRDGLFDFGEDPNCSSAADDFEGPDCQDGIDNDEDGQIDFSPGGRGDPQCLCAAYNSESIILPACSDACDNDGDGLIDLDDPGCMSSNDRDEFNELECRDGLDNDGDGQIDFPRDPGCTSPIDNDEITPTPAPECSDEQDNDGDGLIDYSHDDGCNSASDDSEAGTCDLAPLTLDDTGLAQGNTASLDGSQVGSCGFGLAPEAVYLLTLDHPCRLTVSTAGSQFNTVLYARSQCRAQSTCDPEAIDCVPAATELSCNQDGPNDLTSVLELEAVSGDLYLFVDGLGLQSGEYNLSVDGEYLAGGSCDPEGPSYIICPDMTECLIVDAEADQAEWTCRLP